MNDEAHAAGASRREAEAHARAAERQERRRAWLRPLALALIAIVVVGTIDAHPGPGLHGRGAGIAFALAIYVAALGFAVSGRWDRVGMRPQALTIVVVGGAGVALAALQPRGATELAGSAAVWMALARLPLSAGVALGVAITAGLDLAIALSDSSSAASVLATTLLCALLGLMAYFMKQSRENEDRMELLLAELEDARDAQAEAAAVAERGRIAGELHDVLAHSLSGAAIQLEGARMLAQRDGSEPPLREAIERAGRLVRDGLADARRAVGALRGQEIPASARISSLVEGFRRDMDIDATLSVEGGERPLSSDADLALYRGVQEALTNVARYAPGATATVVLRYADGGATLTVEDHDGDHARAPLPGLGGGHGLAGMRERVERAGGRMEAGPTPDGWRVRLEVPA